MEKIYLLQYKRVRVIQYTEVYAKMIYYWLHYERDTGNNTFTMCQHGVGKERRAGGGGGVEALL